MELKEYAKERIAQAEKAIAAAGQSALSKCDGDTFGYSIPSHTAPWTVAVSAQHQGSFQSSFAERLRYHEAHLNALKQASRTLLPHSIAVNHDTDNKAQRLSSSVSDPQASLPPWSQPQQMPSFRSYARSDPSIASLNSFEGSRVSTPGSSATIGWAGPWVVTHHHGGPDRMYPARLRTNAPVCKPDLQNAKFDPHSSLKHPPITTSKFKSVQHPQPACVNWGLQERTQDQHSEPPDNSEQRACSPTSGRIPNLGTVAMTRCGDPPGAAVAQPSSSVTRSTRLSQIPSPVKRALQANITRQSSGDSACMIPGTKPLRGDGGSAVAMQGTADGGMPAVASHDERYNSKAQGERFRRVTSYTDREQSRADTRRPGELQALSPARGAASPARERALPVQPRRALESGVAGEKLKYAPDRAVHEAWLGGGVGASKTEPTSLQRAASTMERLKRLQRTRSNDASPSLEPMPEMQDAQQARGDRLHQQAHATGGLQVDSAAQESRSRGGKHEVPADLMNAGGDFEVLLEQKLQAESDVVDTARQQCGSCGRWFAPAALQKHKNVCKKVFVSKRPPMNMQLQRLAGVSVASEGGVGGSSGTKGTRGKLRSEADDRTAKTKGPQRHGGWKQKSGALRAAMQANRDLQAARQRGEDITQIPVYKDMHDDRVPCPHCGRKFSEQTAERHIPKCKDIKAKPSFLKRGTGKAGGNFSSFRSR